MRVGQEKRLRRFRLHLAALAAHLFLSLFFTWPLALNLLPGASARTPGIIRVDRDQNLWNLWWVRHAVLSGQNPFVTDLIWYPTPVSLYFHTLNVFNGLLAIPLLSVFSLPTTYNLIVLFSFVASGYGAFLLVRYVCNNVWAGMIGSVVFAYSAFHIATMRGLLQLISVEWTPFYLLFFLKALEGSRQATRSGSGGWFVRAALPAGFFLFLVALVDWYYTMYMLILSGLIALRALLVATRDSADRMTRLREVVLGAGAPLFLFLLLISPILAPTIAELRSTSYMVPASDEALRYSADLLTFFQPPQNNRLWGSAFENRLDWPFGNNDYEVYFTYSALFLAGVCLFATRRAQPDMGLSPGVALGRGLPTKWFWAGCGALFFLLALGPVLQINGRQVSWLFDPTLRLPMPYQLIERLPVLNISRSPDRFDMPLTLCMAILAGYGANVLLGTRRLAGWPGRGPILTLFFIAVVSIELYPVPYPQIPAEMPAWYTRTGQESGDFSILELPPQDDYWHGAYRMYFQTAHERPSFGGYISREFDHPFLKSTPGFQELIYADGAGDMFDSRPETWNSALALYKVRYIVLQKARLPDRRPGRRDEVVDVSRWREAINRIGRGEFQKVYSDDFLETYRVPVPPELVPFLAVGDGWGVREVGPNGSFRWMGDRASLVAEARGGETVNLKFRVAGLGPERALRIFHGEAKIFDGKIAGLQELTVGPLRLAAGRSTLDFISPEGTVSPVELGLSDDPRQVSFAVLNMRLESVR